MDENTLSYRNIQFTKSHTDDVLIASLIPQRWQSQDHSQFQRSFCMCTPLKMRCAAPLSHGNGQPMQGTPSMTPRCSPLHPSHLGRVKEISGDSSNLCYVLLSGLTWDLSEKSSLDKGIASPKRPSCEGQNCPNCPLLRAIFFMNDAKGKHCSPLQ